MQSLLRPFKAVNAVSVFADIKTTYGRRDAPKTSAINCPGVNAAPGFQIFTGKRELGHLPVLEPQEVPEALTGMVG
jgi:hypothetical protein